MERSRLGHTLEQLQIRLSVMETSASKLDQKRIIGGYRKYVHWKEIQLRLSRRALPEWRGEGQAEEWDETGGTLGLLLPSGHKGLTRFCLAPDCPALDGSPVREPLHLLLPVLGSLSLRNSCSWDISLLHGPWLQALCLV